MHGPIVTVKGLRRALAESDAEADAPLLVYAGVLHALVRECERATDCANDAVAHRYYAEHVIDRLTVDLNRALNGDHPVQVQARRETPVEQKCPDCRTSTLLPAAVPGYLYCTRCGRGSIGVSKPSDDR